MRRRWTKRAERDFDAIADYIGAENPAAAARVVLEIIDQVEALLPAYPAIGRPGRVSGTRELVVRGLPYIVPYRIQGEDVELLRVIHTSRRWPKRLR